MVKSNASCRQVCAWGGKQCITLVACTVWMTIRGKPSHDAAQEECGGWALSGECESHPRYMFWGCRLSCGRCFTPDILVHLL